jgi:hypothetical protein
MRDVHDNDNLEEMLVRSGDYLMERTAQYREQPVRASAARHYAPPRYRRVLVGSAAAATLCVTALAGSFIGGTSSGKVDVALAAWSAIPATPTAEQVENVTLNCGITDSQLAEIENVPPASIPDYMLEPSLVDVRGTTMTAAFFTWTQAALCVQFADGSLSTTRISMLRSDEFAWKKPTAVEVEAEGVPATMIVGFLPPNKTGTDPNSTKESDTITDTQWEVYIEGPGVERTNASVSPSMERFVAWVPATGSWTVTFVNSLTGEERVVGNVTAGSSDRWEVSPGTTITESPNG